MNAAFAISGVKVMEILYVGECPYEDNKGEVLNLQVRLEEGEILMEGGNIEIEMMDDSVIEREVKIINPKQAGDIELEDF